MSVLPPESGASRTACGRAIGAPVHGSSRGFAPEPQAHGCADLSDPAGGGGSGRIPLRRQKYCLTPAERGRIIGSVRGRRFLERRWMRHFGTKCPTSHPPSSVHRPPPCDAPPTRVGGAFPFWSACNGFRGFGRAILED